MSSSDLSPAGSSIYSSNTLHVGDGTWDNGRDTFLLPNLMGLNFDTMRYNGMGNRFRDLPEYHTLIVGHGTLAAITFLFVVPAAIFFAKYGGEWVGNRNGFKMHIYLQILTVFLSTVVLILGWFAVGPERSLTNPHHGIGVAIYTCIMVQFLYGWMMSRLERRRKDPMALARVPTKVWLHKLFGRAIALLGIVQIALGLTLYGSPKTLFILYGVWAFVLLIGYVAFDRYYFEKRPVDFGIAGPGHPGHSEMYSDYGSYLSGSRTELTGDGRRPVRPTRQKERTHWGRDLLAAGGVLGAYEAYKHRQSRKREEREQNIIDAERRHNRPPPPMMSGGRPLSRPPAGMEPPPIGPGYPHGYRPGPGSEGPSPGPRFDQGMAPPMAVATPDRYARRHGGHSPGQGRLSTETWEDEKYTPPQQRHTWRDRILGAGAGVAAFEGARRLFSRKKQDDEYVEHDGYRPPLGGNHSMVSQADVSRVNAGYAPFSPGDALRHDRPGVGGAADSQMTPTTPTRTSRRPQTQGGSYMSYDDDESVDEPTPGPKNDSHTLRNSIATFGALAGFREWNRSRKERREQQHADKIRRQELENEDVYNRRTSANYPRPQDGGRRTSLSGTIMTGASVPAQNTESGLVGSNPELSRHNFSRTQQSEQRPDTYQPPLPAAAGTIPDSQPIPPPPTTFGAGYPIPPPPAGPPPNVQQPGAYQPPQPGSLQMPAGAVAPTPIQLPPHSNTPPPPQVSTQAGSASLGAGETGLAAASLAADRRRRERRGSVNTSAEASQANTALNSNPNPPLPSPNSPPVSVKVKMHNDGRHVTLRRLNEEEAEAERMAQRQERRQRRRQNSSLSSGLDNGGSTAPARRPARSGGIRPSNEQPIVNVPPIPGNSTTGSHRPPSELNLPPMPAPSASQPSVPQHSTSPAGAGFSPPPAIGSGLSQGGVGSPGDAGDGTDLSNFADNRRRRRMERARRLADARGTGGKVEFD
nr:hypothetical protein CFP56_09015 [Quercus suber]